MKKIVLLSTIMVIALSTLKAQTNDLLPKTLRVKSNISFDTALTKHFLSEKKELQAKPILEYIMENILNGKVKFYAPYSAEDIYQIETKEFTIKNIEEKMGAYDETVLVESSDTSWIEHTIAGKYDLKEIKGIFFLDEWYFDANNFTFTKKVIKYAPLFSQICGEFDGDKLISINKILPVRVCELNFDKLTKREIKKSNKRLVHYATVKFEQKTRNYDEYLKYNIDRHIYGLRYENDNAPFFTSYSQRILAETIFNKVLSEEKTAYDFHTHKRLTSDDIISERMGAPDEIVMIEDSNNPDGEMIETVIRGEYDLTEIQSYIFTEDWYLDPKTLRIVKKIHAIAPVRYFIIDDNSKVEIHKKIVFELEF